MTTFFTYWLTFGLGSYTSLAIYNRHTFKKAPIGAIILGFVLGALLPPFGLYICWYERRTLK